MKDLISKDALHWALENAPVCLLIVDTNSCISSVNRAALNLLGYKREEMIGRNIAILISNQSQSALSFPPKFKGHPDFEGISENFPVLYGQKKDGVRFPLEVRTQPSDDPVKTGAVIALRDLSYRLRTQEKLKSAVKLQRLWAALIENSLDFIGIADETGKPIYVNPAGRKMVGMPADLDVETTHIPDYYTPDQQRLAKDEILNAMMTKGHWIGETKFRHWQTEQAIPVSDMHFLIKDPEDGQLIGMGTITRDISERIARERAEASSRSKSEVLATVSHELRTPLGIINGFAEILLEENKLAPVHQDYVQRILKSGQNLLQLVNDLLDLEKIDAGKVEVNLAPVKTRSFFDELAIQFEKLASSKKLDFSLNIEAKVPEAFVTDEFRLRQIFINILGNAIKYTDQGSVRATVAVRRASSPESKDQLVFLVSDTGVGIKTEHRDKIFEPFFSLASNRVKTRYGGTGLGLGLAQKLARRMGGDVRLVHSEVGKGSLFEATVYVSGQVFVPLEKKILSPPQASAPQPGQKRLKGMRILYVDDVADNRKLVETVLMREGARVDFASNGQEGVEKALHHSYGIVLMDIQMPGMDGIEATRVLREKRYVGPIVAVSAQALRGDLKAFLKTGFNDYLTKPFMASKLVQCIQEYTETASF